MEEEKEPVVEIEKPTETEQTVEVDITEKPKEETKTVEPPKKSEPVFDERRIHNIVGYQVRQQTKDILQKIDELSKRFEQPTKTVQSEEGLDPIDIEAQKDWKSAVRRLGREEAEAFFKSQIQQQQQQEAQRLKGQLVERSKSFVLSQYPQLADEGSDEAKVFTQVWNENPTLWQNPEGYRLAMYEMEERMRSIGRTPNRVKHEVDKEVKRQLRASASSVVGNRTQGNGKVVLTKEQQQVCEQLGIKYEDYAKTMKALDNKEDITV